jgi:heat shock protein HtpX
MKSWLLIGLLTAVLVVLGGVIGVAWAGRQGAAGGIVVAAVLAFVLSAIAYYGGDKAVLRMSGARQIQHKDHPQLFNVVEEMSIAAGLPMPKVYIIDDAALNAFATGRKPESASVAITSGLLSRLNRDELQGVIAHEMSHVRNRDILYMTMAGVIVGSVALLADMFVRSMWYSGAGYRRRRSSRQREGGGVMVAVAIVAAILAPIAARLLYLACSRRREYLADASAAQLTRYPDGLACALEKLKGDREILESANRATAPMYIVNPLEKLEDGKMAFANLGSTHPPIDERVKILRSMSMGASLADYEQAWQKFHAGERLASSSGIKEASETAPIRAASDKPTSRQTPQERLSRAHEALDMVRRLGGFLFIACACGAQLKIPPTFPHAHLNCPRCGATHDVKKEAKAKPDDASA